MEHKPQKRHKALQPLSREHHHGLLLSWKIRAGFSKAVEVNRIKVYADWFYTNHLIPHFTMEEKYIFSLLEDGNELKTKALQDHEDLKQLFTETNDLANVLSKIETTLDRHIRFEERVLFPEIQKVATKAQFEAIERIHNEGKFIDNTTDEFWV